jgi:hypothetical protein
MPSKPNPNLAKSSQIGPSRRQGSPRKGAVFLGISLAGLSLFNGLRGPPGPKIFFGSLSRLTSTEPLGICLGARSQSRSAPSWRPSSNLALVIHRDSIIAAFAVSVKELFKKIGKTPKKRTSSRGAHRVSRRPKGADRPRRRREKRSDAGIIALAVGQTARTAPPSSRGAKRRGYPGVAAAGLGPRPRSRQGGQPRFSPTRFAYAGSLRERPKRKRLRRGGPAFGPAQKPRCSKTVRAQWPWIAASPRIRSWIRSGGPRDDGAGPPPQIDASRALMVR